MKIKLFFDMTYNIVIVQHKTMIIKIKLKSFLKKSKSKKTIFSKRKASYNI